MGHDEADARPPAAHDARPAARAAAAAVAGPALLALLLGAVYARTGPRLESVDAITYVLVAEELRAGRGLRAPLGALHADGPLPGPDATLPFTIQAPGYPLLLAALGASRDAVGRALAWNALCHALTAAAAAALALQLARSALAAAVAGAGVAGALPLLAALRWTLADPTFVLLSAATALLLARARDAARPARLEVAAGVVAAAAVGVRYAGLALLAPLGAAALVAALRALPDRRAAARAGALAALRLAGPLLLVALLGLGRGDPFAQDTPRPPAVALELLGGILADLPLMVAGGTRAARSPEATLGAVALTLTLLGALGASALSGPTRRALLARGADAPLLVAAGTCALLLVAFGRRLNAESRYALPVLPPLLAAGAAAGALLLDRVRRLPSPAAPVLWKAGATLLVAAVGLLPLVTSLGVARRLEGPRAAPLIDLCPQTWARLRGHVPRGAPVLTNAASVVAWVERRPAFLVPQVELNTSYRLPTDPGFLPRALRSMGGRHLVLFCGPRGLSPEVFGEQLAALSRREPAVPGLRLAWSGDDGCVWELVD